MPGFPRPFATEDADDRGSSSRATKSHDADGATFDEYDEFVPETIPEPGPFLDDADALAGEAHVAFHRLTREIFEERRVYDATFGYNLARLNLDTRHPNAGFRYAVAPDDTDVLLAEFTPTTKFCPQSDSLTVGSFRAWNGLSDRHEYDRVSVAVAPLHHDSTEINEKLRDLERRYRENGTLRDGDTREESEDGDDGPATPF